MMKKASPVKRRRRPIKDNINSHLTKIVTLIIVYNTIKSIHVFIIIIMGKWRWGRKKKNITSSDDIQDDDDKYIICIE